MFSRIDAIIFSNHIVYKKIFNSTNMLYLFCANDLAWETKLCTHGQYCSDTFGKIKQSYENLEKNEETEQKYLRIVNLSKNYLEAFFYVETGGIREYPDKENLINYVIELEIYLKELNKNKYQELMNKMIPGIIENPKSCLLYLAATKDYSEDFDSFVKNGTSLKEMRLRILMLVYLFGKHLPDVLNGMDKEFFELLQTEHLEYVEQIKKEFEANSSDRMLIDGTT